MSTSTPIAELSRMTVSELRKELQVKRAELAKMRLGLAMQSEKNHALYKTHKKDVARMTMVLVALQKSAPVSVKAEVAPKAETKKVSNEKTSQAKKKSVKQSGSKPKKA